MRLYSILLFILPCTITSFHSPLSSTLFASPNSRRTPALQLSKDDVTLPSSIQQSVLRLVYPAMLEHIQQYGHPNIPLGNTDGKRCKTIRKLFLQNKLSRDEISLLEELGFRLRDLEEIYEEADFDDILTRLTAYKQEHGNLQIPKKYNPHPELGAWVAMVRRYGPENIPPSRRDALDAISFEWKSQRQCGSSFMTNYRDILSRKEKEGMGVFEGEKVRKWVRAQKLAYDNGNLSEVRVEYMDRLLDGWKEFGKVSTAET